MKINYNLPKRAPEPYGYTGNDESWEVARNNSANVKFKDNDFETQIWDDDIEGYKPAWYDDWEARFPSDEWRDIGKLNEFVSWVKSTWTEQATNETFAEPITYRLNTDVTLTNYQNDDSYTLVKEMADGKETGIKIITFTKDTPAYRLTKFRAEAPQYMEIESATYYYLFTLFFLMIDSRAKNMFFGFHGSPATGLQFINRKTVFEPYDMDTAIGTNNSGVLKFGYYHLDTDTVSNIISGGEDEGGSEAPVFNGQDSVLWMNFREAFRSEYGAMYRELRANRTWTYDDIEQMYEDHQSYWPEALFNEDAYVKYLVPLIENVTWDEENEVYIKTDRYLTMLQGSKELQRKWWLYNRFRYFDSMFTTGSASTSFIEMRLFNSGTLNITPAVDLYVAVSFGRGSTPNRVRTSAGVGVSFPYEVTSSTTVTEMETTIYSADLISDVGDLSVFYGNEFDFSKATKLRRLKLGDSSPNYSNANLTTLNVSNCFLLEEIDCRNCPQLSITLNLEGSPRLERAYFDGTSITGLDIVDGAPVEILHLPSTITTLVLLNLKKLQEFECPSFANVSRVMLSNIDQDVLDPIDILREIRINSQVNIQGMDLDFDTIAEIDEFYSLLDTMTGVSREKNSSGVWVYNSYDKAQVSGVIHTRNITGAQVASYEQRYPYIRIEADHVESILRYMTWDGETVIKSVTCINGEPQSTPPTVPLREADAQYSYTPIGWSRYRNSDISQTDVAYNVIANRDVYAAYRKTLKTYSVTWKNADGTNLKIDYNVPYGTIPSYTGATPTYQGQTSYGWNPEISEVTDNQVYYAKYLPTYTVRWCNISGETLKIEIVVQGHNATPPSSQPTYDGQDTDGVFVFTGWDKEFTNVQHDMIITAQYRDNSLSLIKYLKGTLDEYESTLSATKISLYGLRNQERLASVRTYATMFDDYAIYGNPNLKTIELKNTASSDINGTSAFRSNPELDSLVIYSNSMSTIRRLESLFETKLITGAGGLFVPDSLVSTYKTNNIWKNITILPISKYPATDYSTISDSWDQIILNNNYLADYHLGDTKYIDLGTFGPQYMQLVGMDLDDKEDNLGKARMTWISKGIIDTHMMNSTYVSQTFFRQDTVDVNLWHSTNQGVPNSRSISQWTIHALQNGSITIWYKVSSEAPFDKMTLIINEESVTNDLSGDSGWLQREIQVNADDRIIVYATYEKDASVNDNDDTAYVRFSGTVNFEVTSEYSDDESSGGSLGGWRNTELRNYLKTNIKPQIPENIRNAIIPVIKVTSLYNDGVVLDGQVTVDDIWIPSHHELGLGSTRETTGPVYSDVFASSDSLHKYNKDTFANSWWTRSVNNQTSYLGISESGIQLSINSNGIHGIVIGFCI